MGILFPPHNALFVMWRSSRSASGLHCGPISALMWMPTHVHSEINQTIVTVCCSNHHIVMATSFSINCACMVMYHMSLICAIDRFETEYWNLLESIIRLYISQLLPLLMYLLYIYLYYSHIRVFSVSLQNVIKPLPVED